MARIGPAATLAAVAFSIFVAFQLSLTFFFPNSVSLFSFSHFVSTGAPQNGDYMLGVGKADITG
jgi:hypothetical protein